MAKRHKRKHKTQKSSPVTALPSDARGPEAVMVWAIGAMARRGPEVLAELREKLGMEPSSGHVVDVLMNSAAESERAAVAGDAERFVDALVVTQFLARDLAYKQGKLNVADLSPPSTTH
jgi:hypothetical protein